MSRTVKHPNACKLPRCGLCHPWKRGWYSRRWRFQPSVLRRLQDNGTDDA